MKKYKIKGFPDYFIDKLGNVYSLKNPRNHKNKRELHEIKTWLSYGYKRVNLYKNGKNHFCTVHSLMLETFVGKRPKGMITRHTNGIKIDNRIQNLRWGTAKENWDDSVRQGKIKFGEKRYNSKFTNREVIKIRKLKGELSYEKIAKKYNVSKATITHIMTGRNWKHIK